MSTYDLSESNDGTTAEPKCSELNQKCGSSPRKGKFNNEKNVNNPTNTTDTIVNLVIFLFKSSILNWYKIIVDRNI